MESKRNEKDSESRNNKGLAFYYLGKHSKAIECYDKAIKLDSKFKLAWFNKGNALNNLGKYSEALECYDKAIELDPEYTDALNKKAIIFRNQGKYSEVLQCFDKLLKLDSKNKEAWNNKGEALNNLRKYSEALQCFDEAIKSDSNYKEAWFNKGNSLLDLGHFSEGIKCFDEAIKLDPNYKEAWNNKGNTLNNLEQYSEAIECFDEAIKLDSNYKEAWNNKGNSLYNLEKYSEALECYDKAIELDPEYTDALNKKAIIFRNQGKYFEALQCLDRLIKLGSKNKETWNNKGFALDNLEKYSEAVQCYDEVIKLDPKDKDAWLNKGTAFYNFGKYKEAIKCFDEAIKLNSSCVYGLRYKGMSLIKFSEKIDEGLECLNKSIQIHGKYKECLNDIGKAYLKKGDFNTALNFFDECLELDSNYKEALINKERTNQLKNVPPKLYFKTSLEELKKNKLVKLDLGVLNIGDSECKSLGEILKINYSLEELNLEDNNIGNKGIKYLNEAIQINNSLQKLSIKYNFFDDLNMLNAIKIKLEENILSTRIQNSIVDWYQIKLKKNNLKILCLNNCNLKEIPIEINELKELISLDLQNNELIEIPFVLKLNNLITLNLSKNKIKLELKKENVEFEIISFLTSRIPHSIKYLVIEENEGISKEIKEKLDFIISTVLNSPSVNIILHRENLEKELESSSEIFFPIAFWNKIEIPIEKIVEKIKNLKESNILELSSLGLTNIPKESKIYLIENLCTKLILKDNQFNQIPESILSLTKLKILILKNNNISYIPENISQLTNLKEISLENNKLNETSKFVNLSNIKTLERMWIDNNLISNIPFYSTKFLNLERISICQNKLSNLEGITEWKNLQTLILNENEIQIIPKEIKNLKQLKKLYLNKNKIKSIPIEFRELKELKELQIRDNLIEEIPTIIGELDKLESIDISNNHIKILPASMYYLTKLDTLITRGNPITNPPIEFTTNLNELKGYWKDKLIGAQKCNYLKLIIVGEENVGKTSLVKTLNIYNSSYIPTRKSNIIKEFKHRPLSTDGINISIQPLILKVKESYSLPNNELHLNIWDFGGQEVYHSTHIFFLSSNSIYLIAWNMNKNDDETNRVLYWIQTLNSYVKDPMIILVGTHLDEIKENCKNKSDFKSIEQQIYENISNKTGISKKYIIGVSSKNGKNFDKLTQLIKNLTLEEKSTNLPIYTSNNPQSMVGEIFPKIYSDLKEIIEKEGKNRMENNLPPILEWEELESITKESNIIGEELKRAASFLHYLGFCLYFSNDKELNKYIILNSQWLADTMATLITTKGKFIQKGLIDHQHFQHVWKEPKYPSKIHPILFELLQKFQVLIPITHDIEGDIYSGKSVVPALLSNETKVEDVTTKWNEGRKILVRRIYEFNSFLPSQIFPQFMATIFALFGVKNVQYWRDGILVKKEKIKCLIELDLSNKTIVISFVGKKFISLFKQIQFRLEMVLNKWENLNLEIYVTCPTCSLYPDSNRNKCFKLKECFEGYFTQKRYLICETSLKEGRKSEIKTKKLIPELDLSEVKKIIEWSEIRIEDKIGEGSFAEVYKGKYENNFVAVKKLKLQNHSNNPDNSNDSSFFMDGSKISNLSDSNPNSSEFIREFLLEIGFLSFGQHPNLLQFIGIVLSPPSIVSPFATYGSLFDLLHKDLDPSSNDNLLTEEINYSYELILRIGLDIILGLNYLHSLTPSIIYCNLKSKNVLIMNIDYKNPDYVCKISDFGLSQFSVGRFLVNKNMNPRWAAPEVLERKDQTVQSDIYSFGMVLYELLTKQIPYSPQQNPDWKFLQNVENSILSGIKPTYSKETIEKEFKTSISNDIYKLMELCWDSIPKNRPNSESIVILFYSLLSNYWNEIENHITLPFSLNKTTNQFIEFENYESIQKVKKIASGSYGIISLCKINELSNEKEYIIKEMIQKIPEDKKQKIENSFKIEIEILKKLHSFKFHPNIVQLIGYCKYSNNDNQYWIILEYCNGGNLENYLLHLNKGLLSHNLLSLKELRKYFKDILLGLKHLHDNGYAHLDLKPENVLLKKENDKIFTLCLCDFGTSRIQNNFQLEFELIGNYTYMAPEVYRFHKDEKSSTLSGYDGMKADIWGLGLILFRMLGENLDDNRPFIDGLSLSPTFDSTSYQPFPGIYLQCTQIKPLDRPSVDQILKLIS